MQKPCGRLVIQNKRKKLKPKFIKFTEDIKAFIIEEIENEWSSDQISTTPSTTMLRASFNL